MHTIESNYRQLIRLPHGHTICSLNGIMKSESVILHLTQSFVIYEIDQLSHKLTFPIANSLFY